MKKFIYISFALVIFLFAAAEKSYACSCMVSADPVKKQIQEAFTSSDAVFSGEVIEIKDVPDEYKVVVKFKVVKSWKSAAGKEITVSTMRDSAMCGYSFEMGKTYLVYGSGSKESFSTTNCSRTAMYSANGDAKYFAKFKRKKDK